jgi:hypothetical protein
MSCVEPATHRPLKLFVLDLLYPAVLGALIVFLFIRLAKSDFSALTEPTTHFGIILGVFYAFGFLAAKLSSNYSWRLAFVDCLSSILMFICFYALGLSEDKAPQFTNYRNFYIALLLVVLSPLLRRTIVHGHRPHFTGGLAIVAVVVVGLALLAQIAPGPLSWLTPPIVAGLLYFMLLLYLIYICVGGIIAE